MNFLALDVETANADMSSICQIGIVNFQDGKVVKEWGTYVNPKDYFDPFNTAIHGITEQTVKDAPLFPEVYSAIQKTITDCVIVTHMPFDQTSLRRAAKKFNLPNISCTWLDSARVARRQWEQFRSQGYGLQNLANHFEIEYKAHDAVHDARAAGLVVVHAIKESNQPLEEWLKRAYKRTSVNSGNAQEGNPEGPFYGETIVFTGTLSLPRTEAADLAAKAGCDVGVGITKNTTILVVGIQNNNALSTGYDKSSKHRKAEELISKGQQIRIIAETDFMDMVIE
jgi:DNA polymerase-3 subunit epsilon